MLSEEEFHKQRGKHEIFDPVSQCMFWLEDGGVCVKSPRTGEIVKHYFPEAISSEPQKFHFLKFKRPHHSNVLVSPSGQTLTCNSERIQQIQMNTIYDQGIAFWAIYTPGNCLGLSVGVRTPKSQKQEVFDFTAQHPTKLFFKLDLINGEYKSLAFKTQNNSQKVKKLPNDCGRWVPFVRVKGVGVSLFLTQLFEDPEKQQTIFNVFGERKLPEKASINFSSKHDLARDPSFYQIKQLDDNNLLFLGKKQFRVLRRVGTQYFFNSAFAYKDEKTNNIVISFEKEEKAILQRVGMALEGEEQGCYVEKSLGEWKKWNGQIFAFLDEKYRMNDISHALMHRAYEILLRKYESIRSHLKQNFILSPVLQSDLDQSWGISKTIFSPPATPFIVPNSISLNNQSPFKFPYPISNIISTPKFLGVMLGEINRFCVINRENILFQVGEISLKKGIKKEYQLNQYQKELEEVQNSNFNEPSIYKILKNCLKYADKVKPPENLIKKLEEKKKPAKKQEVKSNQIIPDKSLLNTLSSMGFSEKIAKKALIQCKNASLETAVDLILNKYSQQMQPEKKEKKSATWACQACTLINELISTQCIACETPRPEIPNEVDEAEVEDAVERDKKVQEVEAVEKKEDIISPDIEESIETVYMWETSFAYCPLLIAGVFKNRIRFRLFGPNPKYYSTFYNKDEEFVDLTTLEVHEQSYQIQQKPIHSQFYLSYTNQELKESGYGWISLEDQDFQLKQKVKGITFKNTKQTKKDLTIEINIQFEDGEMSVFEKLEGTVLLNRVYSEKLRAFTLTSYGKMDSIGEQPEPPAPKKQNRIIENSMLVPSNGYVEVILSPKSGKYVKLETEVCAVNVSEKPTSNKSFLPVVASNSLISSQQSYPQCSLQAGQKPLILEHIHKRLMCIEYLWLERLGKSTSKICGFVWLSSDKDAIPVKKYKFQVGQNVKKICLSLPDSKISSYVGIQFLENNQNSQIGLIGILGDAYDYWAVEKSIKTRFFDDQIKCSLENDSKLNLEVMIINQPQDLNLLTQSELKEFIQRGIETDSLFDLKVIVSSQERLEEKIKQLQIPGWQIISSRTVFTSGKKKSIDLEDYKQLFLTFLKEGDTVLLQTLLKEQYREYRNVILELEINWTEFVVEFIQKIPFDKNIRNKYLEFVRKHSEYFPALVEKGKINSQILFEKCLASSATPYGLEVTFEIIKLLKVQQEILYSSLQEKLEEIKKHKFDKPIRSSQSIESSSILPEQSQFSLFYNHQVEKSKASELENFQHKVFTRYLVEKGKFYRKCYVDMINVYNIQNVFLVMEKSDKKVSMRVTMKKVDDNGGCEKFYEELFEPYVWEQVAIKPYSTEMEKNIKNPIKARFNTLRLNFAEKVTCRYLVIEISFSTIPNVGSSKDLQSIPQTEIYPEVQGQYFGETSYIHEAFEIDLKNLTFVKNLGHVSKYSVDILSKKKVYFYDSESGLAEKDGMIQSKEVMIPQEKDPQDKVGYLYSITYLLLDQLLAVGNVNLPNNLIRSFIHNLVNTQRGPISEKALNILKRSLKSANLAIQAFETKFSSENNFQYAFKDSGLKVEDVINLLDAQPKSNQIWNNALWFAKNKSEKVLHLFEKINKLSLQNQKYEDTLPLFQKYGWAQGVSDILTQLAKIDKESVAKHILKACRNNEQLAKFCQKQLPDSYEFFKICLGQLLSSNRKVKIEEVSVLLMSYIKFVHQSCKQNKDDIEIGDQFMSVTKTLNTFVTDDEIAHQYIELFLILPQKQIYLKQFLNTRILTSEKYSLKLIEITLKLVEEYVAKSSSQNQLSLVHELITFAFRRQVDLEFTEGTHLKLSKELSEKVVEIMGKFLISHLCIGGVQQTKIITPLITMKISLVFYLSTLIKKQSLFKTTRQTFGYLFKWLYVNSSGSSSGKSSVSLYFSRIEASVWEILVSYILNEKGSQELVLNEFNKLEDEINKISNSFFKRSYEKKLFATSNKLIQTISKKNQENGGKLIESVFFEKIFLKISKLSAFTTTSDSEIHEKQLANNFKLQNNPAKQPKDWLIYKNGSKNSVYKFDYPKSAQQIHEIILKCDETVTLTKILLAFEYTSTHQETYCIPDDITVEMGKSLENMRYMGKMTAIPDDHFINYSVRVYGFSCGTISSDNIASSLNRNPSTNFIRLCMRCPTSSSVSELLNLQNQISNNYGSSINFLSLQGYEQDAGSSEISSLVDFIEIISQVEHRETIQNLFRTPKIVNLFKESLINISLLMKNEVYEKNLHRFIMRVCEVNTEIGNETIQKYLTLINSSLCARIVSEIVLSNEKYVEQRTERVHQFIVENLNPCKNGIEPFLDRFCQISFILQNKPDVNKIVISFPKQSLQTLIEQQKTEFIAKYITTILTIQHPFKIEGVQLEKALIFLHKNDSPLNQDIFTALIISNSDARVWFMKENLLDKLFDESIELVQNHGDTKKLQQKLDIFTSLCLSPRIKGLINKGKQNIKLFQLMVSDNYSKILISGENESLRDSFVNFIVRSVLGSENQKVIGMMLKESLTGNVIEGNQNFVGQVFLPLLNSFDKVALCVLPYNEDEKKIVADISTFTKSKKTPTQNKTQALTAKFRLPTNILDSSSKDILFEHLKMKIKANNGTFNLALNHGSQSYGLSETIESQFLNLPQSLLMLFKLNPEGSNKSEILGVYYHHDPKSARSLPLNWNDQSFLFLIKENSEPDFINGSSQESKTFIQLHKDDNYDYDSDYSYMEEKFLELQYNGVTFGEVSFTNQFSSTYFGLDLVWGKKGNPSLLLQSAEYWVFQPGSNTVEESLVEMTSSLTDQVLMTNNFSFFEKQFQCKNILRLLRYEKVYQFPASLLISELKQAVEVMKCRISEKKYDDIRLKTITSEKINNDHSLEALVRKSSEEGILGDFLFDISKISELLDYQVKSSTKKTQFLPRKGILKYFEESNGITSMIKVIKKSIGEWKNKDRRQKWSQYALQLEKFSSFPHFFGMYLKDSQTFNLLFDLLSGLPDVEADKKWDQLEAKSSQKLLKIVSEILSVDKTSEFRDYALKHDFFFTIVERLRLLTGMFKREYKDKIEKDDEQISPSKKKEDDGTKEVKKKKGVGYGNDGSSNTKWMKGMNQAELNKEFEVIQIILSMIQNFLDIRFWKIPKKLLENIYESSLLPYLQDALRAGTLLQISKYPPKFRLVFKMLRTFSKNPQLVPILMSVPQNYTPKQTQSLQFLLKSLENTANIFLSCLKPNKNQSQSEKVSEQLAKDILSTGKIVQEAIEEYMQAHNQNDDGDDMKNILELPLDKKYRTLMKDLRFDYIDMKDGNRIKHHYSSSFNANYTPNQTKMIRLAQELADISTALPHEHTNGVYVRCDKDRVDFMQAMIMGSNGTPYGHGAFLFDVYFDDNYPNGPPKVNLTTTGHGKVRFNPNLYACGKVCLSLLGTWRGSASENWDSKVSTLLQVLLSIQAIIMSEQVYFNEPGFEGEQGTTEGEKKNEAYSNIVRYCNIKFAMIDNMRNPPKGFQTIIRRHFYLKQHEIMEECKKWLLYAEKRQANYIGLVNDHNNSWSSEFKKSKTQYKDLLEKAIKELEEEFAKLPVPSIHDIASKSTQKKQKKKKQQKNMIQSLEKENHEDIDVEYDMKNLQNAKEIDINDEKVKDRWSRYIGAMGIDAVSKQAKADILICGLGPMAMQVVKNVVLSGCRRLTLCDDSMIQAEDLSGGFFFTEDDIGKNRLEACMYKIRELNIYVKIDTIKESELSAETVKKYHVVVTTELPIPRQLDINQWCRAGGVKFVSAECRGAFCRVLNDFGDSFEVLDKNGEQPIEVIIKDITCAEVGVVTLLDGVKNPYEDGQAILIKNVEGMKHKQDPNKSINNTIHKVKIINSKSFEIGDTRHYEPYVRNGTAKNIKTPLICKYLPMKQVYEEAKQKLPIDENLSFYDFVKMDRNILIHACFVTMDKFKHQHKRLPRPWDIKDSVTFFDLFKKQFKDDVTEKIEVYVRRFAMSCKGYLPPLCAYMGGFISQEIIKAITQKFKPLHSVFYMDAEEVIPHPAEKLAEWSEENCSSLISKKTSRDVGLEAVIGKDLLQIFRNSKTFMIGAGAIGCELLKNFAMISLGTGEQGKITLTDPDHIENSNLNRQFLFRQKHISKPKSRTAAASILLMNPHLKGHISALLERVGESTKNIFSNSFFDSLTIVANALDNVAARRYVDQRCVENKVPLFESGTLGPKGHIQVIIPYKTESYGSQNDPVEDGEIPHCTLKMFPEETLHCVEWARDIFGKKFSLQPKALLKVMDKNYKPEKDDIKTLNECLTMVTKGPSNFDDCIDYAITKFYKYFRDDIMQLLYTYPLDAKTKNGEPFWKLPKRPPTPILKFDPENILHCTFIASMSILLAKIYKIPYPKEFRQEKERFSLGKQASKIKIPDFVPSDEKAKAILKESLEQNKNKDGEKEEKMEEQQPKQVISDKNEQELYEQVMKHGKGLPMQAEQFEKDDDQNGHIDFIYSMANLRAVNYKLDEWDWITTKLKAGRIVPALATTTTCVAGLQTLQICKYLKKVSLEHMRNSFLNLAVPSLQMSEPGQVKKVPLTADLTVNLWDRWDIKCSQNSTFNEVYQHVKDKYGLVPIGVLQGMSRIDTSKTEEGIKEFLNSKLVDRLEKDEDYIDIVILCVKAEGEDKILEGVPPVRLCFKN